MSQKKVIKCNTTLHKTEGKMHYASEVVYGVRQSKQCHHEVKNAQKCESITD